MKKFAYIFIAVIFVASCTTPDRPQPLVFDLLKSEKKIYALNDSSMPYMILDFEFTYPVSFKNDTLLTNIQEIFVNAFAGEEYSGRSPKGAFEAFEKTMSDEAMELAVNLGDELSGFSDFYQKVKTVVIDTTMNVGTIKTESESYMGGAHGSYTIFYYNIDLKDGRLIKEDRLFKAGSENKIPDLLLESLRSKYGESFDDVLFETDTVEPNGNFYFAEGGLMYVFNEYEIAPYSSGTIEVLLPTDKIRALISDDYSDKLK